MTKKAAAKQATTRLKANKAVGKLAVPKATKRNLPATAGRKIAEKIEQPVPKLAAEPLTHQLDALLHTMRTIAQHEDELCTLVHDLRSRGKVSKALRRELQTLLAALPAHEYTDDLHAATELAAHV